eukprot:scaffold117718_cov75-Phaeocystis_antarctica.AAC.2
MSESDALHVPPRSSAVCPAGRCAWSTHASAPPPRSSTPSVACGGCSPRQQQRQPRARGAHDEDRVELADEAQQQLARRAIEKLWSGGHGTRRRGVLPHERERLLEVAQRGCAGHGAPERNEPHGGGPQPLEHGAERGAVREDEVQVRGVARRRDERVDPAQQQRLRARPRAPRCDGQRLAAPEVLRRVHGVAHAQAAPGLKQAKFGGERTTERPGPSLRTYHLSVPSLTHDARLFPSESHRRVTGRA